MKTSLAIAVALAAMAVPHGAVAQYRGTASQREANGRQADQLRARLATLTARIDEAQRSRAIAPARVAQLRHQVAQVRRSMEQSSRGQGFVSAGEFASYQRTLEAIDVSLDNRGVPRSYGNDALPPQQGGQSVVRYDCQNEPVMISIGGAVSIRRFPS